jgi:hypothetical protein
MRLTPIAIASITLVILATSAQAESTSKASNQPLAAPQYTCSIVPMPANPAANEIVACNVICSEESGPNVVGSPSHGHTVTRIEHQEVRRFYHVRRHFL